MKKTILLLLINIVWAVTGNACVIFSIPFCQAANQFPDAVIARVKITEKFEKGIRLQILEVYRGEESRPEVIMWDGPLFPCTVYQSHTFGEVGEIKLALLFRIDQTNTNWQIEGDYRRHSMQLAIPGLTQKGNHLKGKFNDAGQSSSIDLSELQEKLSACVDSGIHPEPLVPGKVRLWLFPQPATDVMYIGNDFGQPVDIHLYDMAGRWIYQKNSYLTREEISMENIPAGIYQLVVYRGNEVYSTKVLRR